MLEVRLGIRLGLRSQHRHECLRHDLIHRQPAPHCFPAREISFSPADMSCWLPLVPLASLSMYTPRTRWVLAANSKENKHSPEQTTRSERSAYLVCDARH